MSFFDEIGKLFGDGNYNNPADAASKYYDQIPGYLKQYLGKYSDMGQRLAPQMENQFNQMMNNPGAFYNQMAQGFRSSPGFQYQVNQATDAANKAAAAGGMAGSPEEQNYVAQTTNQMANKDFDDYMNRVGSIFGQGLQGQEGMENQGFQASGQLGEDLARELMNRGNLAYTGAQNANAHQNNGFGNFLGDVGSILSFL